MQSGSSRNDPIWNSAKRSEPKSAMPACSARSCSIAPSSPPDSDMTAKYAATPNSRKTLVWSAFTQEVLRMPP